jgi:hypothetical protein
MLALTLSLFISAISVSKEEIDSYEVCSARVGMISERPQSLTNMWRRLKFNVSLCYL